jgi:hypothetical protein
VVVDCRDMGREVDLGGQSIEANEDVVENWPERGWGGAAKVVVGVVVGEAGGGFRGAAGGAGGGPHCAFPFLSCV